MVRRPLTARHFLISVSAGQEASPHRHEYLVELRVRREQLDSDGYVLDIVALEQVLDGLLVRYQQSLLNDLPEFASSNPSVENFAKAVADALAPFARKAEISGLSVRIWEGTDAWASFTR